MRMTAYHGHDDDFLYEAQAPAAHTTDDPSAKQDHQLSWRLRQLVSPPQIPSFSMRITFLRKRPKTS
jgi:hypothetical protein